MPTEPIPPYIRESDGTIRQGRSVPPESRWLERVGGRDLTFIRVDHQTRLQFGEFEVVIESPFRLTGSDGDARRLDPGVRASLGPILEVFPDALITATIDSDATLRLRLASGAVVDVPADARFEAWQVNGPNGYLVVCSPGGERLAVWSDDD